jgi:hypothetical protein
MSANASSLLEQAQKDFEEKKQQLEESFAKKKAELLTKVKTELASALNEVAKIYETIPEDAREGLLAESMYADFLKPLGLMVRTGKGKASQKSKGTGAPRAGRVSDEQILAAIPTKGDGTRPSNQEIAAKVGLSKVSIGGRLKALRAAKKIDSTPDGTSKRWFKL